MERESLICQIYRSCVRKREEPCYVTRLPTKILINIFFYLSSNQVANCRQVCKKFNYAGKKLLNRRFHYFCKSIPKKLCAVAKTNRPTEIDKQCELHLINSGVITLRAVFGRFIVTGRCCFYPGKILDTLEILYKNTQRRCRCGMSIRVKNTTKYRYSLRRLFHLIELASSHFENEIEPTLPPPKVSAKTKILDLLPTYCDIQCETNIKTYHERIAARFPSEHQTLSLSQMRREVLQQNLIWIETHIRRPTIKACKISQLPDNTNESFEVANSSNSFDETMDVVEEDLEDQLEGFLLKNQQDANETPSETEINADPNYPCRRLSVSSNFASVRPYKRRYTSVETKNEQTQTEQTENFTSIREHSQTLENPDDTEITRP